MKSRAVKSFWKQYRSLSADLQARAVKQYRLWLANPDHPSLQFKKVGPYWSARVSENYRAVGVMDGDTVVWFFIGPHAEYEKLLR
tara:strand:- start:645 stop:899 length:255 start_codon:yes stop_codon:yes gene_type:complete